MHYPQIVITDGSTLTLNILFLELKIQDLRLNFQWIGFGSVVEKKKWLEIIRKDALSFSQSEHHAKNLYDFCEISSILNLNFLSCVLVRD